MSAFDKWLEENNLTEYKDKFQKSGVEKLNDLGADGLGQDDSQIKDYIKNEIGEERAIKSNKIYNAIKALQATLEKEEKEKEKEKDLQVDTTNYGFDFYAMLQVQDAKDIKKLLLQKNNKKKIDLIEKLYYNIDVNDAMMKLLGAAKLLQLAYASSDGFRCNALILGITSKYGSLVKDTFVAAGTFARASLRSLQYHKTAYDVLSKKVDVAITIIGRCSEQAALMAAAAGELEEKTGVLKDMAEKALIKAGEEKTMTDEQRKEVEQKMKESKITQEELEKQIKKLAKMFEDVKADAARAVREAADERQRQFIKELVKAIVEPTLEMVSSFTKAGQIGKVLSDGMHAIGGGGKDDDKGSGKDDDKDDGKDDGKDELDDESKPPKKTEDVVDKEPSATASLEDRATFLMKKKYEIQGIMMERNEALTEAVVSLKSGTISKNQLDKAFASIQVTVQTLGNIKVIFNNAQVFWKGVQANCDELAKVEDDLTVFTKSPELFKKEIKDAIINSAAGWFTLTKVNFDAVSAFSKVDKKMDNILSNLPDENEALQIVSEVAGEMEESLKQERKALQLSMKESKN